MDSSLVNRMCEIVWSWRTTGRPSMILTILTALMSRLTNWLPLPDSVWCRSTDLIAAYVHEKSAYTPNGTVAIRRQLEVLLSSGSVCHTETDVTKNLVSSSLCRELQPDGGGLAQPVAVQCGMESGLTRARAASLSPWLPAVSAPPAAARRRQGIGAACTRGPIRTSSGPPPPAATRGASRSPTPQGVTTGDDALKGGADYYPCCL